MRVRRLFGPFFVVAGILHFVTPRTYERIMPRYLPWHRELVYASGVAEAVAGAATLHPRTRRWGSLLSVATLIGVFPSNVEMALHPERFPQIPGGRATLLARLPLQALLVAWARAAGRD
ncbi:DoxX family protein [Patulibacter sp. S7RM1-6]